MPLLPEYGCRVVSLEPLAQSIRFQVPQRFVLNATSVGAMTAIVGPCAFSLSMIFNELPSSETVAPSSTCCQWCYARCRA